MVTIYNIKRNDLEDNKAYILCELRGLSTDEKPLQIDTNIIENGSVFIEIDTQEVFIYDGENETWLPEPESQDADELSNLNISNNINLLDNVNELHNEDLNVEVNENPTDER